MVRVMAEWFDKLKEMIKAHPAIAGGAALGSGVVIFFVYKNHQAAAAASSTAAQSTTPAAESTPTSADMNAMQALDGFDVASMAGLPYGYVSQNGPVDNYPQSVAAPATTPAPATTSTDTSSTSSSNTATQSSSGSSSGQMDPNPYAGLLGPNVTVNYSAHTYTSPTVKTSQHIPIPDTDQLIGGKQGRVWYVDSGIQHLLTDGSGPPVTNSGFPVNSPQNTPGAYGGGGFIHPVNSARETIWSHVGGSDLGAYDD